MPPAGFEPTVLEGKRSQTNALDRAAAGVGKQLITRKNITCLFYGTVDLNSNFSGSFQWNRAPGQGGESGATHPQGISKMSKTNMLISLLKYALHHPCDTFVEPLFGNNSFSNVRARVRVRVRVGGFVQCYRALCN